MMRKSDFKGLGKVYSFTLRQHYRSRATIVTLCVLMLLAIASVPVLSIVNGGAAGTETLLPVQNLYIENTTEYDALPDGMIRASERDAQATVRVTLSEGAYYIEVKAQAGYDAAALCQAVSEKLYQSRMDAAGISQSQLAGLSADYAVETGDTAEFLSSAPDVDLSGEFAVTYAYSILVMMLCMMSSSYIIRSVVEEKASKLVELTLVSVDPLAMILGKILAVLSFVMLGLIMVAASFCGSLLVTGQFLDTSFIGRFIESTGLSGIANAGFTAPVVAFVSLALGCAAISLLSGLLGAGCSSMDDLQSANTTVILAVMAGYLCACLLPAFDSDTAAVIFSLLPFSCVFCAPLSYLLGNISFAVLCLSFIIQALTIYYLASLTARVYRKLILYSGSRLKLRQILGFAKGEKRV